MEIKHFENKNGMEFVITPQNMKEVNELLRFVNNAKKEPASLYLSFSGADNPVVNIHFRKVAEVKQHNSIRPYIK